MINSVFIDVNMFGCGCTWDVTLNKRRYKNRRHILVIGRLFFRRIRLKARIAFNGSRSIPFVFLYLFIYFARHMCARRGYSEKLRYSKKKSLSRSGLTSCLVYSGRDETFQFFSKTSFARRKPTSIWSGSNSRI